MISPRGPGPGGLKRHYRAIVYQFNWIYLKYKTNDEFNAIQWYFIKIYQFQSIVINFNTQCLFKKWHKSGYIGINCYKLEGMAPQDFGLELRRVLTWFLSGIHDSWISNTCLYAKRCRLHLEQGLVRFWHHPKTRAGFILEFMVENWTELRTMSLRTLLGSNTCTFCCAKCSHKMKQT